MFVHLTYSKIYAKTMLGHQHLVDDLTFFLLMDFILPPAVFLLAEPYTF